jgi:hypothetical protein
VRGADRNETQWVDLATDPPSQFTPPVYLGAQATVDVYRDPTSERSFAFYAFGKTVSVYEILDFPSAVFITNYTTALENITRIRVHNDFLILAQPPRIRIYPIQPLLRKSQLSSFLFMKVFNIKLELFFFLI